MALLSSRRRAGAGGGARNHDLDRRQGGVGGCAGRVTEQDLGRVHSKGAGGIGRQVGVVARIHTDGHGDAGNRGGGAVGIGVGHDDPERYAFAGQRSSAGASADQRIVAVGIGRNRIAVAVQNRHDGSNGQAGGRDQDDGVGNRAVVGDLTDKRDHIRGRACVGGRIGVLIAAEGVYGNDGAGGGHRATGRVGGRGVGFGIGDRAARTGNKAGHGGRHDRRGRIGIRRRRDIHTGVGNLDVGVLQIGTGFHEGWVGGACGVLLTRALRTDKILTALGSGRRNLDPLDDGDLALVAGCQGVIYRNADWPGDFRIARINTAVAVQVEVVLDHGQVRAGQGRSGGALAADLCDQGHGVHTVARVDQRVLGVHVSSGSGGDYICLRVPARVVACAAGGCGYRRHRSVAVYGGGAEVHVETGLGQHGGGHGVRLRLFGGGAVVGVQKAGGGDVGNGRACGRSGGSSAASRQGHHQREKGGVQLHGNSLDRICGRGQAVERIPKGEEQIS